MQINKGISKRIKQIRSGAIALLFLAAYGVSALAPFMNSPTVSADSQPDTQFNQCYGWDCGQNTINVPQTPAVSDPCGLNNATWIIPSGPAHVTWQQNQKGELVAYADNGYRFSGNEHSHNYGVAPDSGKLCVVSVPVPQVPAVNDPCGLNNAMWIIPANTASVTWNMVNGHLVASTTLGYVFSNNMTTHDYGVAQDSGMLCAVTIPVPQLPKVSDPCGLANATWVQPSNTTQVSWNIVGGHLIATAKAGFVFTGNVATYDYGVAPDSGDPCVKFVRAISPTVAQDPCGTRSDTYTIPSVEGVQYYVDGKPVAPGTYSTHGDMRIDITAKAQRGYILIGEDCWTLCFTNKSCIVEVKPVTPQWPTVNCGPANDSITLPKVDGVTYSAVWQGSTLVVTATANEGYKFPHDTKTVWKFVDKATPCPVEIAVPEDPVVVCGVDNDVLIVPEDSAHVTYTSTGWVNGENTVTATAANGYYIAGTEGKQTSVEWTFYDDATLCETEVIVPADPIVVCGVNNDVVTVPKSDHVTYTQTGWVDGKNTVTATASAGYYIAGTEGATTQTWAYTDAGTSCGHVLGDTTTTPNATPTSAPQLENTGNSIILPMLMSTGVLGLAVMTVLQSDKRSGRVTKRLRALFDKLGIVLSQPFVLPTI